MNGYSRSRPNSSIALVNYLTTEEARALIAAPDTNTWTGRRDHALLLVAIQTGLRVSELTGLRCQDVRLGTGAHLYCQGKRRKQRVVPLTSQTVKALNRWLTERGGEPSDPLFPSTRGGPLSRDAVEWLINKHTATAAGCPSLKTKRVTAHALRHTNAMTLLQSDISTSVIALWLGHEHEDTTRAISTATSDSNNGRWTAPRRPEPDPAATARPISS